MNNIKLRYNAITENGQLPNLRLNIPLMRSWDLNGINESIDVFENEIIQSAINPIDNMETTRYSHKPSYRGKLKIEDTAIYYNFYFYSAQTDSSITATTNNNNWVIDYRANGFTDREIYYYENVFSNSYFKLDFYDTKKTTRQQILSTLIIPVQQGKTIDGIPIGLNTVKIKKPEFVLNHIGDKEGYYFYWLKSREFLDVDTLYMSCKFYDAKIGQFKRMMNVAQGELQNKFNFSQETYFFYTLKLNYETYQYEVFIENETSELKRIGIESSQINWYEYVNP